MSAAKRSLATSKKPQPAGHKPISKALPGLKRQLLTKNKLSPPAQKSKRLQIGTALAGRAEQHRDKVGQPKHSNKSVDSDDYLAMQSNTSPMNTAASFKVIKEKTVNTNLITEEIAERLLRTFDPPVVSSGFCDRLTLTFGDSTLDDEGFSLALRDAIRANGCSASPMPHLVPCNLKKASLYYDNFRIKSASGKKLALLQIRPKSPRIALTRLDFNPKAIGSSGMKELTDMLSMLFGPNYRSIMGSGKITRLDASVDVDGQHVGELIAYTSHPQESSFWMRTFPKHGGEEWICASIYYGAKDSGRRFLLYDKALQLYERGGPVCLDRISTAISGALRGSVIHGGGSRRSVWTVG